MTQRIPPISPADAQGQVRGLFNTLTLQLGGVPNIFETLAQSPAVLNDFLCFNGALAEGTLDAKLREQIALMVAGHNGSDYCASAHALLAKKAGASGAEIAYALAGTAIDERSATALSIANIIVARRGRITDQDLDRLRFADFSDEEIVEIVANVALSLFTNYFNHVARTDIDFPRVSTACVSAAA